MSGSIRSSLWLPGAVFGAILGLLAHLSFPDDVVPTAEIGWWALAGEFAPYVYLLRGNWAQRNVVIFVTALLVTPHWTDSTSKTLPIWMG